MRESKRARTSGLLRVGQALYQLSYGFMGQGRGSNPLRYTSRSGSLASRSLDYVKPSARLDSISRGTYRGPARIRTGNLPQARRVLYR